MGIDTPGVVALLGAHSVGRTHCVKLVHRLYPEVDSNLNPDHVEHMLHKCPDAIPDPKAVQYVRNDRGTPMIFDNNYYRNLLDNKGLLLVDHNLVTDKRTKPYVKKMAKSNDYFFEEFSRAFAILSENNPLTGNYSLNAFSIYIYILELLNEFLTYVQATMVRSGSNATWPISTTRHCDGVPSVFKSSVGRINEIYVWLWMALFYVNAKKGSIS